MEENKLSFKELVDEDVTLRMCSSIRCQLWVVTHSSGVVDFFLVERNQKKESLDRFQTQPRTRFVWTLRKHWPLAEGLVELRPHVSHLQSRSEATLDELESRQLRHACPTRSLTVRRRKGQDSIEAS